MTKKRILLTYLVVILFVVIGIGYSYLNQSLNLQNGVTLNSYTAKQPVCKTATTLHTETCSLTSGGCYAKGYYSGGSKGTSTITYGHTNSAKLSNGQLTNGLSQGYALDCDVNGNGVVDTDTNGNSTERFYYVSDFYDTNTKSFNTDYATLIYYKNVGARAYYGTSSSYRNYSGPSALLSTLPATSTWKNVSLVNTQRQILNESGGTTTGNGSYNLPKFAYTGRAARLLTAQEVNSACNITVGSQTKGELDSCEFLMEDTYYSKSSGCSGGSCYYWLETTSASSSIRVWIVIGYDRYVYSDYTYYGYGVRPAVDVAKTDISLE